jgi:phosphoribosylanthranilate isomerase
VSVPAALPVGVPVRVKVCCIASVAEARLAVELGASALGLVSAMPSGPGPISEDEIALVAASVPPGVSTFLLTALTDAEAIAEQHARLGTQVLQLVDRMPDGELARLRRLVPTARLVPVIHVLEPETVDEACAAAECADALLLDSGRPDAPVKELGGTGRTHDWEISEQICRKSPVPVFLAGGLDPLNVVEAIRTVRPFGVDLCSGVRTDGALDRGKLGGFMAAVRSV